MQFALTVPTVVDRLIQQALLQVLQPLIDPTFSEFSYGFRPGRSAHDAVRQAQRYAQEGYRTVVDVDLEKFFDRVNHDVLMDRLARRVADKAVLRLIRRYLQAGIMADGVVIARDEGTPQGGPLSPLLANVLLDEVDQALHQRGHRFARYADDCNVYVRSQKAGERVLRWMRRLYAQLHLRVNETKTEVGPVFGRKFLGYCLRRWSRDAVKIAVAPKALNTFKQRIRSITRRVGGRSMAQVAEQMREYLPGWKAYFQLAQTSSDVQKPRLLDTSPLAGDPAQAMATRLDSLQQAAKSWRPTRVGAQGSGRWRALVASQWLRAASSLDGKLLRQIRLSSTHLTSTSRTARCGPACRVVWQGRS